MTTIIDLGTLFSVQAKLADLEEYIARIVQEAGEGHNIVLTGSAPIWLYLAATHALHGRARSLTYRSPVTGDVKIFDHDPF